MYKRSALFNSTFLLCFLLLFFTLTSCGLREYQEGLYDNEEKLNQPIDSYTFKNRVGSTDTKKAELEFASFVGLQSIWTFNVSEDTPLLISYDVSISEGDFKVIFVSADGMLSTVLSGSGNGEAELTCLTGANTLKIVGRYSSGNALFEIVAYDPPEEE